MSKGVPHRLTDKSTEHKIHIHEVCHYKRT